MNLRWKIAQAAEIRWWQNYLGNRSEKEYLAWENRLLAAVFGAFGFGHSKRRASLRRRLRGLRAFT